MSLPPLPQSVSLPPRPLIRSSPPNPNDHVITVGAPQHVVANRAHDRCGFPVTQWWGRISGGRGYEHHHPNGEQGSAVQGPRVWVGTCDASSSPFHNLRPSFPAVGRITAAELIAEIGDDRSRYPTPQHLLAEAGAVPVTLSSGKIQRVRIRYACSRRLRSTSTTWAYTLKRIDPISRERYLASLDRGATRHGALRAISASWLRVLWRCWQDNTRYDPAKHRSN